MKIVQDSSETDVGRVVVPPRYEEPFTPPSYSTDVTALMNEMLLPKGSRIGETGERETIPAGPVNEYGEIDYELSAEAEEGWFFPDEFGIEVKSRAERKAEMIVPEAKKYTAGINMNDFLANSDAMEIISDDMLYRTGKSLKNTEPDKLLRMWATRQRALENYNLFYGANRVYEGFGRDEVNDEIANKSSQLWEIGKGGMFQEGTTIGQGLQGALDTGIAILTDPTTILSFGYGSAVKRGVIKAGVELLAADSIQKFITTKLAGVSVKGVNKKTLKGGIKVKAGESYMDAIKRSSLTEIQKRALLTDINQQSQRIVRNLSKVIGEETVNQIQRKGIRRGAATIALVESTMTGFGDYLYQTARGQEDENREFSVFQMLAAAALGVFGGAFEIAPLLIKRKPGINSTASFGESSLENYFERKALRLEAAATLNVKKEVGKINPQQWLKVDWKQNRIKFNSLMDKAKEGSILRFTAEGRQLGAMTAVRKIFLFGDDELEIKGLIPILKEMGIEYNGPRQNLINKKTGKQIVDGPANWLADVVMSMPVSVRKEINLNFKESLAKMVPEYKGKTLNQALKMDAAYVSEAGTILQQVKQSAGLLYKGLDDVSLKEALNETLDIPPNTLLNNFLHDSDWVNRQVIRAVVTHPGTVALNANGWKAMSMFDSVADLMRVVYFGGKRGIEIMSMVPDPKSTNKALGGSEFWNEASNYLGQTRYKIANIFDMNGTADMFDDLISLFPEESSEMLRFMYMGVDAESDAAKSMGLDRGFIPKGAKEKVEYLLDKGQALFGVRAIDMITKQQELLYSVDKLTRRKYNMSYVDLLKSENVDKILDSDKFVTEVYIPSVIQARRQTFNYRYASSKEHRDQGNKRLKQMATIIEQARSWPLAGILVPFGTFVVQQFVTMFDSVGITRLNHHFIEKTQGKAATTRDALDLSMRTVAGVTAVLAIAKNEEQYLEEGLPWTQKRAADGTILDKGYDFPVSWIKVLGRGVAHYRTSGEVPKEFLLDAFNFFVYSPFRPLVEAGQALKNNVIDVFSRDDKGEAALKMVTDFAEYPALVSQMGTRPAEIFNSIAQLLGDDFVVQDRNQKNKTVANAIRYIDEGFKRLGYEAGTEKFVAGSTTTGGRPRRQIGAFNYGVRFKQPPGVYHQMMAQVGRPVWSAGNTGPYKEVNNKLNFLIGGPLHHIAERRRAQDDWINGTIKDKGRILNEIRAAARDEALLILSANLAKAGTANSRLAKLADVHRLSGSLTAAQEQLDLINSAFAAAAANKGIEPVLYPKEIEDLNDKQLNVLRVKLMQNTELQSSLRKENSVYKNSKNMFPKYDYDGTNSIFNRLD